MKTTVELSDAITSELKRRAREKGTSMREIIESALRLYLDTEEEAKKHYRFPDHSFQGNGVCEGVEEGAWERIRSRMYEGRGG
jgi:hypothetical protein